MDAARLNRLEELLKESVEKGQIAGANVMVIHKGKEVYYAEQGYADIKNSKPIKKDTIFRLYSMSKPITATAVMLLVERGVIDLLDPVAKYIDSFTEQTVGFADKDEPLSIWNQITIKDCMNMTSGLPYGYEPDKSSQDIGKVFDELDKRLLSDAPMTTLEFAQKIGDCRVAFVPGSEWRYGVSADILGAVIEVATGMRFGEFLEKEFFKPLGMVDTGFEVAKENRDRLAVSYEETSDGLIEYTGNNLGIINAMNRPVAFQSGGAGLVSTIEDYKKFTQMLMQKGEYKGKRYLGEKTVEYLTTCQLLPHQERTYAWNHLQGFSYGNLMRVLTCPEQATYIGSKGEYGWDGWLGPYFANMPEDDTTFIFMVQKKDAGTFDLTRKLRNALAAAL